MSVFTKVTEIIKGVRENLDLDDRELYDMTQKLANKFHYKTKKDVELSKKEAMLYEYYINNKINPSTLYRWMIVLKDAPTDVMAKLTRDQISGSEAKRLVQQYKGANKITQKNFIGHIAHSIHRYLVR